MKTLHCSTRTKVATELENVWSNTPYCNTKTRIILETNTAELFRLDRIRILCILKC